MVESVGPLSATMRLPYHERHLRPAGRATRAAIEEAAAPLWRALDALEAAGRAVRTAGPTIAPDDWAAWCRAVQATYDAADLLWFAVETIAPEADPNHWDLIEGQGSLFHASYAGVTLGLIHGSQPDALVVCHEHGRAHMRGLPTYKHPSLEDCIARNVEAAKLTNAKAKCVGISINTQRLSEKDAVKLLKKTEDKLGLPTVDPMRTGVDAIVDVLR